MRQWFGVLVLYAVVAAAILIGNSDARGIVVACPPAPLVAGSK